MSWEFRRAHLALATLILVATLQSPSASAADEAPTLWSWGGNSHGQLGRPVQGESGCGTCGGTDFSPGLVQDLPPVRQIAAGWAHSLALDHLGRVWAWGGGTGDPQPGYGFPDYPGNLRRPRLVPNLSDIISVEAGMGHSLALDNQGRAWVWGLVLGSSFGEPYVYNFEPQLVNLATQAIAISAGQKHNSVLLADGSVWAWGDNFVGQLGNGSTTNNKIPTKVRNLYNVISIAAGASHSIALTAGGQIYSWGSNDFGALGIGASGGYSRLPTVGPNIEDIKQVYAGAWTSFAIDYNGKLFAWGYNLYGQLGDGTTQERPSPVETKIPIPISQLSVDGSGSHVIALARDGRLWAWGRNFSGQLGDGTSQDSSFPKPLRDSAAPRPVGGLHAPVHLASGSGHTLVLTETGDPNPCPIYFVGARGSGESYDAGLGMGDTVYSAYQISLARLNGLDLRAHGLNYPAVPVWPPYFEWQTYYDESVEYGAEETVRVIQAGLQDCSTSKFILAGYSQGAHAIAEGLLRLTAAQRKAVAAVALLGDPKFNPSFRGSRQAVNDGSGGILDPRSGDFPIDVPLRNYCKGGDGICSQSHTNIALLASSASPHATYAKPGPEAQTAGNFLADYATDTPPPWLILPRY